MTAALAIHSAATTGDKLMPFPQPDLYDNLMAPNCFRESQSQFSDLNLADTGTESKGVYSTLLACAGVVATTSGSLLPPVDMLGSWGNSISAPYALISTQEATTAPAPMRDRAFAVSIAGLLDGYEQLDQENWDGYDAAPITTQTLRYARALVRAIPDTFGLPDIAPSGDGSIGLEWVLDAGHLHKLFLDIGPGEVWRAYWSLRDGSFGRLPGKGFDFERSKVLTVLFANLSGLPNVAVRR
ncbi:MAG: hypothetical protein WBO09_11470 [Methylocystis silviterrae]